MTQLLKNENIEIHVDVPNENYNFSRFDWTGKIVQVKFQNTPVLGVEKVNSENENQFGKGLYNEFGIDTALGFDETEIGGWFHKIGVGVLKKDDSQYTFSKAYEIKPAEFKTVLETNKITIRCASEKVNGYSYLLEKEIILNEGGFTINYYLKNTGEKDIRTTEYVHNFMAINSDKIGDDYRLDFPFQLKSEVFEEVVNPEQKIEVHQKQIKFTGVIQEEFFFSNLAGGERVNAEWELTNHKSKIGIKEIGNFKTSQVNLWGNAHVISPELFYKIFIKPGKFTTWSRSYSILEVD